FLFIAWLGLPGTIQLAGFINITIALCVWYLIKVKHIKEIPAQTLSVNPEGETVKSNPRWSLILLGIAFFTGLASFIYEIAWLRMLNLVLGSSTHAFELMLSAFILGLALGGLWIRNRIDNIAKPKQFLAYVQIAMALLALLTLPAYSLTFDAMQWIMTNTPKTEQGYWLFNISSHLIALAIMLPATFCAGMTLPLLTHLHIKQQHAEKSIGYIYALNTLGAIAGVLLAIHVIMPSYGLRNLVIAGVSVDLILGLGLLFSAGSLLTGTKRKIPQRFPLGVAVVGTGIYFVVIFSVEFDAYKMASGVYRHGHFYSVADSELMFHKDGKTATVDIVHLRANNEVSIITNGKPDASINMHPQGLPSPDEATMTLLAVLPLAHKPDGRQAAVIGLGSGMSSHVLLSSQQFQRVDTIEIEPAIVEAANYFRPRVENVYAHPSSRIQIEDAKTFFSTQNKQYDIIISEPSNPWVSGIASLFTDEFYRLVNRHLNDTGVFAQWLQLYEIDMDLLASVMKGIGNQFNDYRIYAANNNDLVIIASHSGRLSDITDYVFTRTALNQQLRRIRINQLQDLQLHYIGDKKVLAPLFADFPLAMNSDYFPVLDLNAVKARFLQRDAMDLFAFKHDALKTTSWFDGVIKEGGVTNITPSRYFHVTDQSFAAMLIRDAILYDKLGRQYVKLKPEIRQSVNDNKRLLLSCTKKIDEQTAIQQFFMLADSIAPYLSNLELNNIWQLFLQSTCYADYPETLKLWLQMFTAVSTQNASLLHQSAQRLEKQRLTKKQRNLVIRAAQLAAPKTTSSRQAEAISTTTNDGTDQAERLLSRLVDVHRNN
ncbi:MAG: spermidine synthase, partial [Thiohalomonadales bacterium]